LPGLYLHIPFCRKACHYCNFHFSTSLAAKDGLLTALYAEIRMRSAEAAAQPIPTIYFGGGTPSLLEPAEIRHILDLIHAHYRTDETTEVSLEANPDDLTPEYLQALQMAGVHRLSIGIQSFREEDLRFMNRSHDAGQARRCLQDARAAGFQSINADLIYGIPGLSEEDLLTNIHELVRAGVDHLSAYALTVEPRTALDHFVRSGKAPAPSDEQTIRHFRLLKATLAEAGFEHYEISNWALPGKYSRHNISYWQGRPYLGFGPSAHSYDGKRRSWNIANNARYIRALSEERLDAEEELLRPQDHYNEYVLTRLRTRWGCRSSEVDPAYREHFLEAMAPFLQRGWVREEGEAFILSDEGENYADGISAALFAEA
jgi:oxygen-independent coproporphyrinogen III oxidase